MSYVVRCRMQFSEIEDLKTAAQAVGFRFAENQTTYKVHGQAARCDHALVLPNATARDYEVGVVPNGDGTYGLALDTWGPGAALVALGGADMTKVKQEYQAATAVRKAAPPLVRAGFKAQERVMLPGNRLRLRYVQR